jgi:alpha-tubulin suppressor-like RCC1 family protein
MTQPYLVKAYNYTVANSGASTAPFLTKLHEHFSTTSTLWEVDSRSSTTDISKGFTIKPKTGLQFQINFRRFDSESNRVSVTIDPDSSITNSLEVLTDLLQFKQVEAGQNCGLAIDTGGGLWGWGSNANGRIGVGSVGGTQQTAGQVGGDNDWFYVSSKSLHTHLLKDDGTLWALGSNAHGRTGRGTISGDTTSPTLVVPDNDWATVAAGLEHSLAIKTDGTLWSWGSNENYRTGQASNIGNTLVPTQIGIDNNWSKVATSEGRSLAIKTNGTLWSWGSNENGATGQGVTTGNTETPTQVGTDNDWLEIKAGGRVNSAIKTDGTLWSWGGGGTGGSRNIGNGVTTSISAPTKIGVDTNWSKVSVGSRHSLAIKTDGTLWSWGLGISGQLGHGDTTSYLTPIKVGADADWVAAEAGNWVNSQVGGGESSLAIKTNVNTLKSWGSNSSYQTGLGVGTGNTLLITSTYFVETSILSTASAKSFLNNNAFWWSNAAEVGGGVWIVEMGDALFIMNKMNNKRSAYGFHVGRVFTPFFENDPANGMEGFGILGNRIGRIRSAGSESASRALIASTQTSSSGGSRIKISNEPSNLSSEMRIKDTGFTSGSWGAGGRRQPVPYATSLYNANSNVAREIGFYKYFYRSPYTLASGAVFKDTLSNQSFLYNVEDRDDPTDRGLLIPWEYGVQIF